MRHGSNAHKLGLDGSAHRLRDAFVRATTSPTALRAEKQTPGQSYKELIQCLSREIDETVLPRRFALISEGEIAATMVISNRRLIELVVDGEKIGLTSEGDLDPDSIARTYAQALKAVSACSGPLLLRPIGRAEQTATNSAACTAQRLSEFCESSAFENRMHLLLKFIHSGSLGWIFRSDEEEAVAHDPKEDVFLSLRKLDEKIIAQSKNSGRFSHVDKSKPSCAAFALSDGVQALIATDGKGRLIAAVPQAKVAVAMDQWQKIFGRSGHLA